MWSERGQVELYFDLLVPIKTNDAHRSVSPSTDSVRIDVIDRDVLGRVVWRNTAAALLITIVT